MESSPANGMKRSITTNMEVGEGSFSVTDAPIGAGDPSDPFTLETATVYVSCRGHPPSVT